MNEYTKIFMEAYGDSAFNEDTVGFAILESASAELIAYQPVTEGLGDAILWVIRKISDIVKAIIKLIVKAISTIGKAIKRLLHVDSIKDEEVVKSVEKNNKALNDIHKSNVDLKKRMEEDERELRERKARYDKIVKDSEERRKKMIEDSERKDAEFKQKMDQYRKESEARDAERKRLQKEIDDIRNGKYVDKDHEELRRKQREAAEHRKKEVLTITGLHSNSYEFMYVPEFKELNRYIYVVIKRIENMLKRDDENEPLSKFRHDDPKYTYDKTDVDDQATIIDSTARQLERNKDCVLCGNRSLLADVLRYLMNEDNELKTSLGRLQQVMKSLEFEYGIVSKRFEEVAAANGYSKEKAYKLVNQNRYHWMEYNDNDSEEFRANLKYIKSWNVNIEATKGVIGSITKVIAILLKDQQKIAAVGIDM